MSTVMSSDPALAQSTYPPARKALEYVKRSWFAVALMGQWLFVYYLINVYAKPVWQQDLPAMNATDPITGYVAGDTVGNLFLLAHVLLAIVLSLGGLLQFVPQLRAHAGWFHRWNGRLFLAVALIGAVSGLYLTWVRGSRMSDLSGMGVTLNGLLIPIAVWFAWKYARDRRFDMHRQWAIRAFLLVSGVWTLRLMLMGWIMLNQGPRWNSATFDGPMDQVLSFGCYLLPLAIAQLCFRAERDARLQVVAAVTLGVATAAMAFGIFAAYMMMWRPHL